MKKVEITMNLMSLMFSQVLPLPSIRRIAGGGLLAASAIFFAAPAYAQTNWTDWTMPGSYPNSLIGIGNTYATGTTGTVNKPSGGSVTVTLSGEVMSQSRDNFNEWSNGENPAAAYDSFDAANGGNPATQNADIIMQTGFTEQAHKHHTVTFSESVSGVVMGIWSLGGGQVSSLLFSEDFEIVDDEGDGSTLTRTVTAQGYKLTGTANAAPDFGAAGLIRFHGSHTSITYTVTEPENYSGISVALTDVTSGASGGNTITIDTTAPTLTSTTPADNATNVAVNSNITLVFSENVVDGGGSIVLKKASDNSTVQTFTGFSGNTVTLNPSSDLAPSTAYYIQVTSTAIKDTSGNAYAGINDTTTFSFQTAAADSTGPTMTITAAEVSDGGTSDNATLTLTFTSNEATSDFAVGDITVANGSLSNFAATSSTVYTATLTPTAAGAVTVDVAAGTFTDAASNANSAATQFNWTYGSNPLTKADVVGNIKASANAATRFAQNSLRMVNHRLDWLRRNKESSQKSRQGIAIGFADPRLNELVNGKGGGFSQQGLTLADAAGAMQRYASNPDAVMTDIETRPLQLAMAEAREQLGINPNPTGGTLFGDWSGWTEGKITVGKFGATSTSASQENDSLQIALGLDRPWRENGLIGVALTLGKDDVDVGSVGSGVESDNYSLAVYGAFQPEGLLPLEGQIGVGHMQMDTKRIDGSQTLSGARNANLIYGSLAARRTPLLYNDLGISPYGRVEAAHIRLNGYSESGGALALAFANQRINRFMLFVGSDIDYKTPVRGGTLRPFGKLEYGLDLTGTSNADMHYVGDSTHYRLGLERAATSHWNLTVGADFSVKKGLTSTLAYERTEAVNAGHSDSVRLHLNLPF